MYTIQVYTSSQCHFIRRLIRRVHACLGVICRLHFWQNDRNILRATAVIRGWTYTETRVSTAESWPWTRKFSRRSCRDSNPKPFDHKSGTLPLSYPSQLIPLCLHGWLLQRSQRQNTVVVIHQEHSNDFVPTLCYLKCDDFTADERELSKCNCIIGTPRRKSVCSSTVMLFAFKNTLQNCQNQVDTRWPNCYLKSGWGMSIESICECFNSSERCNALAGVRMFEWIIYVSVDKMDLQCVPCTVLKWDSSPNNRLLAIKSSDFVWNDDRLSEWIMPSNITALDIQVPGEHLGWNYVYLLWSGCGEDCPVHLIDVVVIFWRVVDAQEGAFVPVHNDLIRWSC